MYMDYSSELSFWDGAVTSKNNGLPCVRDLTMVPFLCTYLQKDGKVSAVLFQEYVSILHNVKNHKQISGCRMLAMSLQHYVHYTYLIKSEFC